LVAPLAQGFDCGLLVVSHCCLLSRCGGCGRSGPRL
jgi:hypothetical protein